MLTRRGFIAGLIATPAIVRAGSLDYVPSLRTFRIADQFFDQPLILPKGYDKYIIERCTFVIESGFALTLSDSPAETIIRDNYFSCGTPGGHFSILDYGFTH